MKKSIAEWKKLAQLPEDNEAKHRLEAQRTAVNKVVIYEKYKPLLKPSMIKFLKKWANTKKGPDFMAFCMYGDQKNVYCRYEGHWTENFKGKIVDFDPDGCTVDCTMHEDSIVNICWAIDELDGIKEFNEVVRLLIKIDNGG